jgi:hypothetical protein
MRPAKCALSEKGVSVPVKISLWYLLSMAMLVAYPAFAHHSSAGRYDSSGLMEVEGDVSSVSWRSPHVVYRLEVAGDSGAPVSWMIEGAAPATLSRSGLNVDTIKVGDHVRVAGWPPVGEKKEMFLQNVLLPTGDELLLWVTARPRWSDRQKNDFSFWRQTEGVPSRPELGIFRVWSSSLALRSSLFSLNPADAANYPLTESALETVDRFQQEGRNLTTQGCSPKGMPLMMEQPYPMEFRREGENVILRLEEYDAVRTIHMDRETPPAGIQNSLTGYSVGQWDGETLVVTTTHIDWPWFSQIGIPQSTQTTLVERFTPAADGSSLSYELTATDPVNFTRPFSGTKEWLYLPDQEVRPYECQVTEDE